MDDNTPLPADDEAFSPRSATALRELEARARAALTARRGQVSRLEAEINRQLEEITSAINSLRDAENNDANQIENARAEVKRLCEEVESTRAAAQLEKSQQSQELEKLRAELKALNTNQAEQAKQFEEGTAERLLLEADRDDLAKKIAKLESQHRDAEQQWQKQLAEFESKLAAQQAFGTSQQTALEESLAALQRERDELQQKFELALQDVQRFRGRTADLEQELARRPEAAQADSAELVALRAERDALAERVEQLERQPPVQVDANSEQQFADLQRRFELAVEDVRELKTKNAELESKLAGSSHRTAGSGDGGAMDWESQKRRLLASLEDNADGEDPIPEKERATIEGTIEMTDAIVADKDREIERLRAELVSASSENAEVSQAHQDNRVNELLDADAVIAEHRQRIAQMERDMEEKLRAAELELSVERAKIARQKAELEELKIDLDSKRQPHVPASAPGVPAPPRRRWLSKLGLSSEEEG
jgi:chromosome segregation ATPase